jgi:hypothetical protein
MSGASKRAYWDLIICGAGLVYVALALFINLDSPLFALVLIILAGYELLDRRAPAKPPRSADLTPKPKT